jgi:hypothetical protein
MSLECALEPLDLEQVEANTAAAIEACATHRRITARELRIDTRLPDTSGPPPAAVAPGAPARRAVTRR